jgi:uncharacterized membrane protein YbhN (UPF0104 family)
VSEQTDVQQMPSMSLGQRFRSWQTVLAFVTLAGAIFLVLTRFDVAWSETWNLMRGMNPLWYLGAIAIHYTTFFFRGARWRMLLENSARRDDLPFERRPILYYGKIILISWFANSVTFFRMGDAYRAYAYAEDTKSSFPRAAGSVLADRVIDLSVVGSLMGVGIVVLLIGDVDPPLILIMAALGLLGAIVAGLLSMVVLHRWIVPLLPQQVASAYHRFHDGTMGSFGRLDRIYMLGVLGWLMEIGRLYFVTKALGLSVATGLVIFVPMANGVLSAIPLTPGGLAVVETGISGLLRLDLALELALAVALLDRTVSYLSIIGTGGTAFAIRQFSTRQTA